MKKRGEIMKKRGEPDRMAETRLLMKIYVGGSLWEDTLLFVWESWNTPILLPRHLWQGEHRAPDAVMPEPSGSMLFLSMHNA